LYLLFAIYYRCIYFTLYLEKRRSKIKILKFTLLIAFLEFFLSFTISILVGASLLTTMLYTATALSTIVYLCSCVGSHSDHGENAGLHTYGLVRGDKYNPNRENWGFSWNPLVFGTSIFLIVSVTIAYINLGI
jgi:magnesium-transporting ATPase (P-type)